MCGIIYVDTKDRSAVKATLKRYRKQSHRGKQGFGYIALGDDNKVSGVVRRTGEDGIVGKLLTERANRVLFHHRLPTSLPNYEEATHPIVVKNDKLKHNYYVIHNGVISNAKTLYDDYKKDGWVFTTEMSSSEVNTFPNALSKIKYLSGVEEGINDSEAFAIDIANYIEGRQTYVRSSGSIAFIALITDKEDNVLKVAYGHNSNNPLILENDRRIFSLKSVGHGTEVPVNKIFFRDIKTGTTTEQDCASLTSYSYNNTRKVGYQSAKEKDELKTIDYDGDDVNYSLALRNEDEGLTKALDKTFLPAPKSSSYTPKLDWTEWTDKKYSEGYSSYLLSKGGFITTNPITIKDVCGFTEDYIEEGIKHLESQGDTGMADGVRALYADLSKCIDTENDAREEFSYAHQLFLDSMNGANREDVTTARAMLNQAKEKVDDASKDTKAAHAELEAWLMLPQD
jgi:hypothetical protein